MTKRVVITGMGAISPFGRGVGPMVQALEAGRSGISRLSNGGCVAGLRCLLAGLVPDIDEKEIPRKFRRSMSRMSIYAVMACQEALETAGLQPESPEAENLGVVVGSTMGSAHAMESFFREYIETGAVESVKSTTFFKVMSHSVAANIAQVLGLKGMVLGPSAACATGCQAIGLASEMIAWGRQEMVLCGGADEFHPLTAATFDMMNAASTRYNDHPQDSPRPFDIARDGVVCAEGSGILLLESLDSAIARSAPILGEIIGFGMSSDPTSIASPNPESISRCIRAAIRTAGLIPADIDYINAHATATIQGDAAECQAIAEIFGADTPVSSLKGYLGHTMAASGALELIGCVHMAQRGLIFPTRNLDTPAPDCASVLHVGEVTPRPVVNILKNNFALGGINSAIIIRRWTND